MSQLLLFIFCCTYMPNAYHVCHIFYHNLPWVALQRLGAEFINKSFPVQRVSSLCGEIKKENCSFLCRKNCFCISVEHGWKAVQKDSARSEDISHGGKAIFPLYFCVMEKEDLKYHFKDKKFRWEGRKALLRITLDIWGSSPLVLEDLMPWYLGCKCQVRWGAVSHNSKHFA